MQKTEQVVGTWIDGKPLYEITITGTAPNVTSDGTASNGLLATLIGIDTAMVDKSFAETNVNNWSLPYINNAGRQLKTLVTHQTSSGVRTGTADIVVTSTGTAYNGSSLVAIVRYTKTTDTATRGGNVEQTRSANLTMNTGSLVGSGEKSNLLLEELEEKELEEKQEVVEEKKEEANSGEEMR